MSMDDIFKLLVESRQPAKQQPAQSDPMTDLIGGLLNGGQSSGNSQAEAVTGLLGSLLGGGQSQSDGNSQPSEAVAGMLNSLLGGGQPQSGGSQSSGLGSVMSLLEMVTGAGQQGLGQSSLTASNPIMGMLEPFVTPLAKKMKISPEIAMIVVSFAAQKLLAHHPTSGRDSNQFDLDDLLGQLGSGSVKPDLLHNSGLVDELSKLTGLDKGTATQSLDLAFNLVTKKALSGTAASVPARPAAPGKTLKSAGSGNPKITR
jgi:hypothetical protein